MIPLFAPKPARLSDNRTAVESKIREYELVSKLKSGEADAAPTLYETYSVPLYGIIRRLVQDEERAEIVLQHTFENILLSISQYDPAKLRLFTWMTWIARQMASDELNNAEAQPEDTTKPQTPGQVCMKVIYTAASKSESDREPNLADAIEPKYRMILNLIYFQGFSPEEIAERFSITVKEVKIRLAIAVKQLRLGINQE